MGIGVYTEEPIINGDYIVFWNNEDNCMENCPGWGNIWTQFELWSPEAAEIVLDANMELVMDRCLKIEHARFAGGLHLSGFDTGVIDSRRNR